MKIFNLECPTCQLRAKASLDESYHKFIVYTCPKCQSNVVYYKNKIDILPDHLLKKLLKKGKLTFCGDVSFPLYTKKSSSCSGRGPITKDDLLDLKILLGTENDSSRIISRL